MDVKNCSDTDCAYCNNGVCENSDIESPGDNQLQETADRIESNWIKLLPSFMQGKRLN